MSGPSKNLLRDGHWGYQGAAAGGLFKVATAKQMVQLTVTAGDTFSYRDYVTVAAIVNGTAVASYQFNTLTAEFDQWTTLVDMTSDTDGILEVSVVDSAGDQYWTLNAIDVRPLSLVAPLVMPALAGSRDADGLTTDTYTGSKAQPGAVLTVTAAGSNGRVLVDADPAMKGTQVVADGSGNFTFPFLRPTGKSDVTFTVKDRDSAAAVTTVQTGYLLPDVRRLDLTTKASLAPAGYLGFAPAAYTSAGVNALGYTSSLPNSVDRGTPTDQLQDVHWNFIGKSGVFHLDMPQANFKYALTLTLGDSVATDNVQVSGTGVGTLSGNPSGVTTAAGAHTSFTFAATTNGSGAVEFTVSDLGGGSVWSLSAIEIRPYPAVQPLAGPGAAPADGATPVTVTGSGAAANALVTVATDFGTITSPDASSVYSGIQVMANGSGNFSFQFTPGSSTTNTTANLAGADVTGAGLWERAQSLTGVPASPPPVAASRFDFNGASNITAAGRTGVRGSTLYSPAVGCGWATRVLEFERAAASINPIYSPVQLYQDGAYYLGTVGKFQVKVTPGTPVMNVRVYMGDTANQLTNAKVTVEGNATPTLVTTTFGQFVNVTLTGSDANSDGLFWVTVGPGNNNLWTAGGMDFSTGALPAPLTMGRAAPNGPAGGVTVTADALAPLGAEAVRRWEATGLTADESARLRRVTFNIADLTGAGHFGEHVGGAVTIDDNAGGFGWYLDPTPATDAEFTAGPRPTQLLGGVGFPVGRVDLLTVLMHELGHELGRPDLDAGHAAGNVMAETLVPGERRLPAAVEPLGVYVGPGGFAVPPTVARTTAYDLVDVRSKSASAVAAEAAPVRSNKPAAKPTTRPVPVQPADGSDDPFGPWVG